MHTTALSRATGLTALLVALGVAAPAQAAVTIGNNLADAPTVGLKLCQGSAKGTTCTIAPSTLAAPKQAAGGLTVPFAGVVVSWRVRNAAASSAQAALRVVRGNTGLGRSAFQVLSGSGPFGTRLSVAAGDRLGLDLILPEGENPAIATLGGPDTMWDRWEPWLGINETRPPTDHQAFQLLLNAVVEPDADADGFGDESQDLCPPGTDPAGKTGNGCPPPPAPPPPPSSGGGTPAPTPASTPSPGPAPGGSEGTIAPSRSAGLTPAPRITGLQFTATSVRFRISDPAAVTLTVHRVLPGRKLLGRCLKPTARNRKAPSCPRLMRVLSGRTNVDPGLNTARLRRLVPGRYRVQLASTGLTGRRSTVTRYYVLRR